MFHIGRKEDIEKSEKLKDLKNQKKQLKKELQEQEKKLRELRELKDISNIKKKIETKKRKHSPRNVSENIFYQNLYENGLMRVDDTTFSKMVSFSDINYQIADSEMQLSIFNDYCSFLNRFDPNTQVQLLLRTRRFNEAEFNSSLLIPDKEMIDFPKKYVNEFNKMLRSKALESSTSMIREKYITFSINAENEHEAIKQLNRIEDDVKLSLNRLGCVTHTLNGKERLRIFHEFFRPNERTFNFDYSYLVRDNRTTKDYIYPSLLDYNFNRKGRYYMTDDYYGCTMNISNLPPDLTDEFISQLSELEFNQIINIHFNSVDVNVAKQSVLTRISYMESQKITEQQKAVRNNYDPDLINNELRSELDDAYKLLDDLDKRNQKMFLTTILIYTSASTVDELENNIYKIAAVARKHNIDIEYSSLQQCNGMNSSLPIGVNFMKPRRTLTTASLAIFMPFTTQELMMKNGFFYGVNALTRNMITFDRRTGLKASNGLILATPGSGKSFLSKEEIFQILATSNDQVIIIDPEGEYISLTNGFNGTVVDVSASSASRVNPFECDEEYGAGEEDPIKAKAGSLLALFEVILGTSEGLSTIQRSILDRCIIAIYSDYFNNSERTKADTPTFRKFYEVLKLQPEQEAKNLVVALEMYVTGSFSIFSELTNVDCDKQLVDYNILNLQNSMKTVGMHVVLDHVWNKIIENYRKGIRTWIYIDEFYLMLQNQHTAEFFEKLWKRARKWGAVPTGITQNVEDLLNSPMARTIISNTEFLILLNQANIDGEILANMKNISKEQLNYITNSEPGHGLLLVDKSIIPFINEFPTDTELYKLMTTKFEDKVNSNA